MKDESKRAAFYPLMETITSELHPILALKVFIGFKENFADVLEPAESLLVDLSIKLLLIDNQVEVNEEEEDV